MTSITTSGAFSFLNNNIYHYFASQTAAVIDETKTKTRKALSDAQRENEAQLQTAKLRLVLFSVPLEIV